MTTTVFSAPPGWGKTRRAKFLARFYRCRTVTDDWLPGAQIRPSGLHLTNVNLTGATPPNNVTFVCEGWKEIQHVL